MPRVLGLGLLFAASSAAAEPPLGSTFGLTEVVARPVAPGPVRFQFESPTVDYSRPDRPERKLGFLAAVQVAPNGFIGIGLLNRKTRRSAFAPEEGRDTQRGGKKMALRYVLSF